VAHRVATKRKPSKTVYLMRGAPASGKSFRAKQLAGSRGVVCEVDNYFGPPGKDYAFNIRFRDLARAMNMILFLNSVYLGKTPIVVDRGNGRGERTRWYIATALLFGYTVKFAEPTSWWWKSVKTRLVQRWPSKTMLWVDAGYLAKIQKTTHRVSRSVIFKSLMRYDPNLTVEEVMEG